MSIEGVFFDLGGTLFSYRNLARTNIPIMVKSARRLGSNADVDEIKKSYGRATQYVSHQYADRPYYCHRDLFHDLFKRFCEILQADYDPKIHEWYHTTHQAAVIECLEIKPDCIRT